MDNQTQSRQLGSEDLVRENGKLRDQIEALARQMDAIIDEERKASRGSPAKPSRYELEAVEDRKRQVKQLKDSISKLKAKLQVSDPARAVEQKAKQLEELHREHSQLLKEKRRVEEQVKKSERKRKDFENDLEFTQQLNDLKAQIKAKEEEAKDLGYRLKDGEAKLKRRRDELAVKSKAVKKLEQELAARKRLMPEEEITQEMLQEVTFECEQLQKKIKEGENEWNRRLNEMQNELALRKGERLTLEGELQRREKELHSNELRIERLRRELRLKAEEALHGEGA